MTDRASQFPGRAIVLLLLHVVGLGLLLAPTGWVLRGYFAYVAAVVIWTAATAFVVYRAPKRALLIATLGPIAALLILMLVHVRSWVASGMVS